MRELRRIFYLMAVLVLVGCGYESSSSETAQVSLKLEISTSAGLEKTSATSGKPEAIPVKKVVVSVEGPDMDTITESVPVGPGDIIVKLRVPSGLQRIFMAQAFGEADVLLFQGTTTSDLVGEPVLLSITLQPVPGRLDPIPGPTGATGSIAPVCTVTLTNTTLTSAATDAPATTNTSNTSSNLSALIGTSGSTDAPVRSWGKAMSIEMGGGNAYYPRIAVDSSGNAVAVWVQNDEINSICANRYVAGIGWQTAALVASAGNASDPRVAVDPSGNAIAVWEQDNGIQENIWANRYDVKTGAWGTTKPVETDAGHAFDPQIAVDPSGNAIAVWVQNDGTWDNIWANQFNATTGAWGTAELIEANAGNAGSPQVAVGPSGNAIAVWVQNDEIGNGIFASRYDVNTGAWGTAELIETGKGDAGDPRVAVDASGNAIAVWQQHDGTRDGIWANRYDVKTGTWGTAELIETGAGGAGSPQVAVDTFGNAIAVWVEGVGNVWANRFNATTGAWGTAELIGMGPGGADSPQIAVDPSGNAIAVWVQNNGVRNGIWANRFE